MNHLTLLITVLSFVMSMTAYSNDRKTIINDLSLIQNNWTESQFKAWINDGRQDTLRVGENVVFRFLSDKNAYLTILHVDAYGMVNVSFPLVEGNQEKMLSAGKMRLFPSYRENFSILVEPPIGRDSIFFLATEKPIDKQALGLSIDETTIPVEEVALFLRDLQRSLKNNKVAVSRIDQKIIGRNNQVGYNQNDVANMFEKKLVMRSFSRRYVPEPDTPSNTQVAYIPPKEQVLAKPKLNLYINFEFASAQLTETAKANLDEVGLAFQRKSLAHKKFILSGHTDDVGDNRYNQALSEKRALAAKNYLTRKFRISPARLMTKGYGESDPIEAGDDEFSRAANRRVEIETWQPGMAKVEAKPTPEPQQEEEQEREPTVEWLEN